MKDKLFFSVEVLLHYMKASLPFLLIDYSVTRYVEIELIVILYMFSG
jgi:hypothetical protein